MSPFLYAHASGLTVLECLVLDVVGRSTTDRGVSQVDFAVATSVSRHQTSQLFRRLQDRSLLVCRDTRRRLPDAPSKFYTLSPAGATHFKHLTTATDANPTS